MHKPSAHSKSREPHLSLRPSGCRVPSRCIHNLSALLLWGVDHLKLHSNTVAVRWDQLC
ncbi:hypothetical protein DPEC_G00094840, partial [Dallia pectoralis]